MLRVLAGAGLLILTLAPAPAADITAAGINDATYTSGPLASGQSALTAKLQILLDRAHMSPGVIDGLLGDNVRKAIRGLEEAHGLPVDGEMDEEVWRRLNRKDEPVMARHRITEEDLDRIVEPLPEDYAKLAEKEWLGYTSVEEKLAERFHMDVDFLRQLNPEVDFTKKGSEIWVADPGADASHKVKRVVADKSLKRVLAFDGDETLVASYPATIGSRQTPSPDGTHKIVAIAIEPTYSYRPDENFVQGDNKEPLTLPPGPNGPVGLVWIDLSKPTYGLHGTPEPAEIDKTASHGCVRLTNWDARELAGMVSAGVPVEFVQ